MKAEELGPSLLKALAELPDPRSRHGRRHPSPAILALSGVAMLAGARGLYAIAHWGREQPEAVVRALGFTRGRTPGVATLHRVFKLLDVHAFEAAVAHWAQAAPDGRGAAIAMDGTAVRGIHGDEVPGVRLVAAYDVETGLVLAHQGGEGSDGKGGRGGGGSPRWLSRTHWPRGRRGRN
jgi:DDE_Tnp_1-associated